MELTEYFVLMNVLLHVRLPAFLALVGVGLVAGCGGPPAQAKGGVQIALPEPATCQGRECYTRDELNRFQRVASLYARMYAMKTIDNRGVPVEGHIVLRCRVDTSEGRHVVSSVDAVEQSVGTDEFYRRLGSLLEGACLDPGTAAATSREYHLYFSRDVFYAQSGLDTTSQVILPALQWFH